MKGLIVGMDIGASRTKVVILENSQIMSMKATINTDSLNAPKNILEELLKTTDRKSKEIKGIAISGGGTRLIRRTIMGLPVTRVNEITAIGMGGLELSGKKQALIVSMGTGTAMVAAFDEGKTIKHVGGTGVGGGTIEGLSRRMLGIEKFEEIEEMANKGRACNIDLTVADIVGGPVGILPGDATASNFKKLSATSDGNDVAAAIFNMVSEVTGMVAVMVAKTYRFEKDTVFIGKLIQSRKIAERISAVTKMFNVDFYVPPNGEYCVAIGAAKSII